MKKVVAVLDDDLNIRNLLFDYLKESEFEVVGEKSGKGLVDLFDSYKGHIDILVLDMVVPDLHRVKSFLQNTLSQNVYVILITGYNIKNLITELRTINSAGVFSLLRKPFSKQAFLKVLRECTVRVIYKSQKIKEV